jgi:hypothetical protein
MNRSSVALLTGSHLLKAAQHTRSAAFLLYPKQDLYLFSPDLAVLLHKQKIEHFFVQNL